MPIDINPVIKAGAVRFPVAHTDAAPQRPVTTSQTRVEAGVEVDADPALGGTTPPVDAERVAVIRKALEEGSYPVVPSRIADAMIAARYMLSTAE